jgi:hypothetical protein
MADHNSLILLEEVMNPVELAEARVQREQFDRSSAWLQAHVSDGIQSS